MPLTASFLLVSSHLTWQADYMPGSSKAACFYMAFQQRRTRFHGFYLEVLVHVCPENACQLGLQLV